MMKCDQGDRYEEEFHGLPSTVLTVYRLPSPVPSPTVPSEETVLWRL
jgi:hypothetical protein